MVRKVFAVAILVSMVWAGTALAQMPAPFAADMIMKPGRGGEPMNGKLYFGANSIRVDMNAAGHQTVMITDLEKRTSYVIMPQQRMYMEMSADSPMRRGRNLPDWRNFDPNDPCAIAEDYTCTKLGSETANGRDCDKWQLKPKSPDLQPSTAWVDKKLHFPVRMLSADGTEFNLTNVREGSQPASLFEVPAGYKKMDFGGMPQSPQPN